MIVLCERIDVRSFHELIEVIQIGRCGYLLSIRQRPKLIGNVTTADATKNNATAFKLVIERAGPLIDAAITGRIGDGVPFPANFMLGERDPNVFYIGKRNMGNSEISSILAMAPGSSRIP